MASNLLTSDKSTCVAVRLVTGPHALSLLQAGNTQGSAFTHLVPNRLTAHTLREVPMPYLCVTAVERHLLASGLLLPLTLAECGGGRGGGGRGPTITMESP